MANGLATKTKSWAQHEQQAKDAKLIPQQRKAAKVKAKLQATCCSAPWMDHHYNHGGYPSMKHPTPGMVLCVALVRFGLSGPKGRRWTPRECADMEDTLDQLRRPERYIYPSSCGSVVDSKALRAGYVQPLPED